MQTESAAQTVLPELAERKYRADLEAATEAFSILIRRENGGSFRDAPEILQFRPRLSLRERLDKLDEQQKAGADTFDDLVLEFEDGAEPEPAPEPPLPRRPTVREIFEIVRAHFGLLTSDLLSHRRNIKIVRPRQIIMYLAREMTLASLPQIALTIGGRDHTTAMHGIARITDLIKTDPEIAAHVDVIRKKIAARFAPIEGDNL